METRWDVIFALLEDASPATCYNITFWSVVTDGEKRRPWEIGLLELEKPLPTTTTFEGRPLMIWGGLEFEKARRPARSRGAGGGGGGSISYYCNLPDGRGREGVD